MSPENIHRQILLLDKEPFLPKRRIVMVDLEVPDIREVPESEIYANENEFPTIALLDESNEVEIDFRKLEEKKRYRNKEELETDLNMLLKANNITDIKYNYV